MKKKKIIKLLAMAVAAVMTVSSLTACGGKTENTGIYQTGCSLLYAPFEGTGK